MPKFCHGNKGPQSPEWGFAMPFVAAQARLGALAWRRMPRRFAIHPSPDRTRANM
jgi:hypothetical protein